MLSSAFQGTTLEQPKNGAVLVNASEVTTWIDSAYLGGRRSIHLSYERPITATVILEHFWTIPKKNPIIQIRVAAHDFFRYASRSASSSWYVISNGE
jgi:hypothetical protein